jgi:hypothetical protein
MADEQKPEEQQGIVPAMVQFGKAILEQAKIKQDESRRERVLHAAQSIMNERDRCRRTAEAATALAVRCEEQLKAIEEGRFHLEAYTARLIFEDPDLNNEPRRDPHGNPVWD